MPAVSDHAVDIDEDTRPCRYWPCGPCPVFWGFHALTLHALITGLTLRMCSYPASMALRRWGSVRDVDDQAFETAQIDTTVEMLIDDGGIRESLDERADSDLALELGQRSAEAIVDAAAE